jgi:hypothetical protein
MSSSTRFLICISNDGYPASLETRKVYQEFPDTDAEAQGLVRGIDESGEDYLFPKSMFLPVELSGEASAVLLKAS